MLIAEIEKPTLSENEREAIQVARQDDFDDHEGFCARRLDIIDRSSPDGASYIPFVWNNAQMEMERVRNMVKQFNILRSTMLKERHGSTIPITPLPIHMVCLKARKVGCSTWLASKNLHLCEFVPGTSSMVMAHRKDAVVFDILQAFIHRYRDDELKTGQHIRYKSQNMIGWDRDHGSRIVMKTAGAKRGSSRSATYHFMHLSEEAWFPRSDEAAAALNAKVKYSEVWEESTANGHGDMFHTSWRNALWVEDAIDLLINGEDLPIAWNGKFRFFWPWYRDDQYRSPILEFEAENIRRTLSPREKFLIDLGIDLEQLKFRRQKIATECAMQQAMPPEDYFDQEYPTTPDDAFVSQGINVFSGRAIGELELKDRKGEYYRIERLDEMDFSIIPVTSELGANYFRYHEPMAGHQYVIGVDTAEGLTEGDWSVVSVWDRMKGDTAKEVARYRGKHDPEDLAEIAYWLSQIYNDAFIIPEWNPPGNATCIKLHKLGAQNVYHTTNEERVTDRVDPEHFTIGFRTSKHTKAMIVSVCQVQMREGKIDLKNTQALEEWRAYRNVNGSTEAPVGMNDDCVMADAMALWAHFTPGVTTPMIWSDEEWIPYDDRPVTPIVGAKDEHQVDLIRSSIERHAAAARRKRPSRSFYSYR